MFPRVGLGKRSAPMTSAGSPHRQPALSEVTGNSCNPSNNASYRSVGRTDSRTRGTIDKAKGGPRSAIAMVRSSSIHDSNVDAATIRGQGNTSSTFFNLRNTDRGLDAPPHPAVGASPSPQATDDARTSSDSTFVPSTPCSSPTRTAGPFGLDQPQQHNKQRQEQLVPPAVTTTPFRFPSSGNNKRRLSPPPVRSSDALPSPSNTVNAGRYRSGSSIEAGARTGGSAPSCVLRSVVNVENSRGVASKGKTVVNLKTAFAKGGCSPEDDRDGFGNTAVGDSREQNGSRCRVTEV